MHYFQCLSYIVGFMADSTDFGSLLSRSLRCALVSLVCYHSCRHSAFDGSIYPGRFLQSLES